MQALWYGLILGCSVACSATEPGLEDLAFDPGTRLRRGEGCGAASTPIHALQGTGNVSPLAGRVVSVEGVVTAIFPGTEQLGGFFLQSTEPDGDPRTSEAVFVFEGGTGEAIEQGQRLRVTGRASEFYGLTQLNELERVERCGDARLEPTTIAWPPAAPEELEAFEGMLVRVPGPLTLTDSYRLERFGELSLSRGRGFIPTGADPAAARGATLELGDGFSDERLWPSSLVPDRVPPRLGDELRAVTGVLNYAFGRYELLPTTSLEWQRRPRPEAPRLAGDFRVAAFNLDNYFSTPGERGAASEPERQRQRSKLGAAIAGLGADLLAVTELENRGGRAAEDLALAAVEAGSAESYRLAMTPDDAGTDAIRSALLYRASRLVPSAEAELELDPVFRRPPLVQRFDVQGFALTVIVVHLKSKRCDDSRADAAEPPVACGDEARLAEAHALVGIARRRSLEPGTDGLLLLGDFNAYPHEEPIQEIVREGFDEFMADVPAAERYSYVFDGQAGLLDQAFGTLSLRRLLRGAAIWHINADESALLDYRVDNPSPLFRADAFRSSDHDPIVLSFDLP
jgi:uncharacterized protein